VIVKGANLINGMLTISLERIVPEEKKSRMIEIGQQKESDLKKLN
jgi:HSP20 family molecular chaperone IbpA